MTATRLGVQGRAGDRLVAWAIYVAITSAALGFAVYQVVQGQLMGRLVPLDYSLYMDAATRWRAGGLFYEPWQLAGPYAVYGAQNGAVLYPPVALYLLVPFTFLPAALWWAIPFGITGWVIWACRPDYRVWPLLAMCLAWPPTLMEIVHGNPSIWLLAFVALGMRYHWPAVFVLLKPSLAPFALVGARDRRWWLVLALFALACLPFGAMWLDWFKAVTGMTDGGFAYSWQQIPLLLIPIIVWLGRSADDRHPNVAASGRIVLDRHE